MLDICTTYRISEGEFEQLDKAFGKLCWKAAHELKKKNSRNNFTDDVEDVKQELLLSMLRAGSYYKRQIYIEKCLDSVKLHAKDNFLQFVVDELLNLWENRTRHGANRQKFGKHQEQILQKLVKKIVPKSERPDQNMELKIDSKFSNYCKAIVWNSEKSMGKKITREKSIRSGQVSLSEYDFADFYR
jgi:hypothetical protein